MRTNTSLDSANVITTALYSFYLILFLAIGFSVGAQTNIQPDTTSFGCGGMCVQTNQSNIQGDGGGAGLNVVIEPGVIGAQRIMTVLIEVGDRVFSADELLKMPALIYGAPINSPDTPAFSVDDIFQKDSYGQTSIVGVDGLQGGADDIFGPFHIDVFNCHDPHISFQEILDENEALLDVGPLAQGVRLLLMIKHNGIWQEGCLMYAGVVDHATLRSDDFPEDEISFSMPVSLRVSQGVIAHELGHVFALYHTGLLQCPGGDSYDFPNTTNDETNHNGYAGDETCGSRNMEVFGYMGGGYRSINHSGAPAKEKCGWLSEDSTATHRIQTVHENGTFNLSPISEENEAGLKALKVLHGGYIHSNGKKYDEWLYIEYRKTINEDGTVTADHSLMDHNLYGNKFQNSNLFSGALLRIGYDVGGSSLFDAFKTQDDVSMSENPSNFNYNWALPFGETYVDSATGTRITLGTSNLTGSVDVDIEIGRTDFDAPEVIDFYIDEAASTDCEVLIRGEVYDTSGISELTLSFYKEYATGGNDYLEVELDPKNGAFSYLADMYRFAGGKVGLRVKDNAHAQGGNAPDNVLDHGVLTSVHGLNGIEAAQINFPFSDFRCDTDPPVISLSSPQALYVSNSHIPPVNDIPVVTNPVVFDFSVTDQSVIANVSIIANNLTPPGIYSILPSLEGKNTIEDSLVKTFSPGTYLIHLGAIDVNMNVSPTFLNSIMFTVSDQKAFVRGDANQDGNVDIADITHITNVLFQGIGSFLCYDAADANDDGIVDISDAQFLAGFLFTGTTANLPAPFPEPGEDPTEDDLNCSGCDCPSTRGPMTEIPDPAFEFKLWRLRLDPVLYDGLVPTANIDTLTSLDVSDLNISDLTGIQDFAALKDLKCNNNQLISLDVSQNINLNHLNCGSNQLSSLDVSQNLLLEHFDCYNNSLTVLDVSQNINLEYLNCSNNQLNSLDLSQNTNLKEVYCLYNQLNSFDVSGTDSLKTLRCDNNQISSLDVSNNTALTFLSCSHNQLTSLNVSGADSLKVLECELNQISSLDLSQNAILEHLSCFDNQLTDLDVSQNINLEYLKCRNNLITHLDITQNINLVELICSYNPRLFCLNLKNGNNINFQLIDMANTPNLFCIEVDDPVWSENNWNCFLCANFFFDPISSFFNDCGSTCILQLTSIPDTNFEQALIDMAYDSGIPDGSVPTVNINTITSLNLGDKDISDLTGIEDFTALIYLNCNLNHLEHLDISQNIFLQELNCQENQLSSLDISNNTALTSLSCSYNQLTSLNISQNLYLERFNCGSNQIDVLDVSDNIHLDNLSCYGNSLISLDVTQNTNLINFNCGANQLSSLDVSQNLLLERFDCYSNDISDLDISQNANLKYFNCMGNQLTSLDIYQNMNLISLFCSSNQLSSLDIVFNWDLTALACSNNDLNYINLANGQNINFQRIYLSANPDLSCIQVDDPVWSETNWISSDFNFDPASSFSDHCSVPVAQNRIRQNSNSGQTQSKDFSDDDQGGEEMLSSIRANELTDLVIYPNPFRSSATIEFPNYSGEPHNLSVYDMLGNRVRLIEDITGGKVVLRKDNLTKGVYFIELRSAKQIFEDKIIVK